MKHLGAVTLILLLSSCAAAPMKQDQARSMVAAQNQQIGVQSRCCTTIEEMNPTQISSGNGDYTFGSASSIVSLDGRPTTASLFALPPGSTGRKLEFVSYSDKKRSVFRFDSVLFVAPTFVFLDSSRKQVATESQLPLCWGAKSGHGGIWTRSLVPERAAYVLVAARTDRTAFGIDTRQVGLAAPAIEAIAEARQSYSTQVGTGYSGLYSLELIDPSAPPLGRCSASAP